MGLIDLLPGVEWLEDKMNERGDPIKLEPDKLPWQLGTGQSLADVVSRFLPGYQPGKEYGGQRTAGMSPQEKQTMALLNQILGTQFSEGELTKLAKGGYRDLLTKDIDPSVDPRYGPIKEASQRELQDQIDLSRRGAGYRGSFFTEGAIRDENRLREQNLSFLNQVLGGLYGEERGRQFQALSQAPGLEAALRAQEQGLGISQIQAGQQYGALPRMLEQSDLESKYQDFIRKQGEFAAVPALGQDVFSTPITWGMKSIPTQTPFQRMLGPLATMAGTAIGTAVGGPAGGAAGAAIGSRVGKGAGTPTQAASTTNITNQGLGSQRYMEQLLKPFSLS
jgi:hypothetical protein